MAYMLALPSLSGQSLRLLCSETLRGIFSVSAVIRLPNENQCLLVSDDGNSHHLYTFGKGIVGKMDYPDQTDLRLNEEGRVPKPFKRDFESAVEFGKNRRGQAFVFGSGSILGSRTFIQSLKRNASGSWKVAVEQQCEQFYKHLADIANLEEDQLNIEGASLVDGKVLKLFNREAGFVFCMKLSEFKQKFEKGFVNGFPEVWTEKVELPQINGFQSGFSSAVTDSEGNTWVAASAEATEDWVNDGQIMGSAIGRYLPISPTQVETIEWLPLQNFEGEALDLNGLKIEAITIVDLEDGNRWKHVFAFTDNDHGFSELLIFRLVDEQH